MSYLKLSPRATNGPLMAYTNFADGSHVNLIEMRNPYKDGRKWTVKETTKSPFCSNGIFKDLETAIHKFTLMSKNGSQESQIIKSEFIDHDKPFKSK